MGQALGGLASIAKLECCNNLCKYVLNAMDVKSKCCGECFECEVKTEEIALPDDGSEYSIEIQDCCSIHKE